jgi:hypothetical protein
MRLRRHRSRTQITYPFLTLIPPYPTLCNLSAGPTPSAHRLQRGLPGYLILFATHAFAPQRQLRAR